MAERPTSRISSRKAPKQARSTELVAAILEAAVQVLAREGAQRFTTARVAEKAGVSVGSLYQYFPNKAAILFRLQSDEWRQTHAMLTDILGDAAPNAKRPLCEEPSMMQPRFTAPRPRRRRHAPLARACSRGSWRRHCQLHRRASAH